MRHRSDMPSTDAPASATPASGPVVEATSAPTGARPTPAPGGARPRALWYVSGVLAQSGGGERVIMEGLRHLGAQGYEATLVLDSEPPQAAALFDGSYAPAVMVIDAAPGAGGGPLATLRRRVVRARRLVEMVRSLTPRVMIANSQAEAVTLTLGSLLSPGKSIEWSIFIHGSPFQFADENTKYALAFRRHFAAIREADAVYREVIAPHAPRMGLVERAYLEMVCLARRTAVARARCVLVLSEKNRREVELLYGHRNVAVIPAGGFGRDEIGRARGRDLRAEHGLAGRRVVLSVCRLVEKKRVDVSLRAFARLCQDAPDLDAVFVVGGSGPHEAALRALAAELGVAARVRFIGRVPERDLRDWYQSCDAFVCSDNADWDMSVAMAWPLGCKVVVSSQFAVPAVLDRMRRFVFVAEPSPAGFARTLREAVAAAPAPLDAADARELDPLTWERYFEVVADVSQSPSPGRGRG